MSQVPYSSAVGSLMYDMIFSHPNLSYVVSVVSRHMANPSKEHWKAVEWIFRYLRGSPYVYLHFFCGGVAIDGVIEYVEIVIKEDLLLYMCLLLEVTLLVGKLLYRIHMCCQLLR